MKYLLCNNGQCLPILSMNKNGRRYSCTLAYLKEQELTRINIQLIKNNKDEYENANKGIFNDIYKYKITKNINYLIK